MEGVTLAYITARKDPKIEWLFDCLLEQKVDCPLILVDFHKESRGLRFKLGLREGDLHIAPKPTVWQGPHRLTKADYFAASNAYNTAIACCKTDWIACVDDLSVLMPGWWERVKLATTRDGITCGSYRKVNKLEPKFEPFSFTCDDSIDGVDRRRRYGPETEAYPCSGQWYYGCSFVARIEDLMKTNGFDEDCDSLSYQDCVAGEMLMQHGVKFWFDPLMMTYESDELHHTPDNYFVRWDPGQSPNDKSHKILELVRNGRNVAPNYFGEGGLRKLREHILSGGSFPITKIPDTEWFSGLPLSELGLNPKWP